MSTPAELPARTPGRDVPINLYRPNAPLPSKLLANLRLTPEGHPSDVRHLVFETAQGDFRYLEGQSVGILPPGLDAAGKPEKLRLYSVASTRRGDDDDGKTVSLCVKRVCYTDPVTGQEVRGVASNYLCDLQVGDEVQLTGPVGRTFLLPEDPEAHVVMIATGTGIAPFRAFWRELFRPESPFVGQARLFFGMPTSAEILYQAEIEACADQYANFRHYYAISREQKTPDGRRMYVQDRIREFGDALWSLVRDPKTFVYICGLKGMEDGVAEAFAAIADYHGVDWTELHEGLKKGKRWHVETY
ncbi:MAG TPA: FAD-binding oxidoreductase [Stenomitos sp.]